MAKFSDMSGLYVKRKGCFYFNSWFLFVFHLDTFIAEQEALGFIKSERELTIGYPPVYPETLNEECCQNGWWGCTRHEILETCDW